MISSKDRYLKEKKYGTSVVRGEAFSCTMQSLSSKSETLRQAGQGNKPNAADALTDRDINRLYEANQLGTTNLRQLTNTVWLNHMTHFEMRARQEHREHRNLCWGDLRLGFDDEVELEYLEFNERVTNTRTGEDIRNIRRQKPRMYARPYSTRCPITAYKIFRDHRPTGYSNPDDPFHLSAVTNTFCPAVTEKWYLRCPIGANTLGDLLPRMAKNANLPGLEDGERINNTSARKRLCQKMTESSIPDDQVKEYQYTKNGSLTLKRTLFVVCAFFCIEENQCRFLEKDPSAGQYTYTWYTIMIFRQPYLKYAALVIASKYGL